MDTLTGQFLLGLIVNAASSFLGVLAAYALREGYFKRRYADWRVRVTQGDAVRVERRISPGKAREIDQEPAELSILLKGTASPYATINCDILEEGLARGLLRIEDSPRPFLKLGIFTLGRRYERTYLIDLDHNPPREPTRPAGLSPR